MRRIRILAKALSEDEIKAAAQLLEDAGFEGDEVDVVDEVGEPLADCDDELALIVLTDEVCGGADLEQQLAKQHNGGRRAICVWPATAPLTAEPPLAVRKYAYSIIPSDANKLGEVCGDDDVTRFEAPSGEPLPKPEMDRLCNEEKAKPQ